MDRAPRKLRGDFARRQIGDLDIVQSIDGAAVVARAARLGQRKSGAGEERLGVFLQPSFGGDRDNERCCHGTLRLNAPAAGSRPSLVSASTQIEKPTAAIGFGAPSCVINPS